MNPESNQHWLVVYTYPNYEKLILKELIKRNVSCYLPLHKVTKIWSDRIKKVEIPLFPNYLFVQVHRPDHRIILSTAGVSRFVTFMGKPAVIPNEEIQVIKRFEKEEPEVDVEFVAGDSVVVTRGPFNGMQGIFFSKKGRNRFGVRLEILEKTLSVEICGSFLRKL